MGVSKQVVFTKAKRRAADMAILRPIVNAIVVRRYGGSLGWLLARPRFLFTNRERSNFTYELDNEDELLRFVSDALAQPLESIVAYADELRTDWELRDAIAEAGQRRPRQVRFARRLGWYCVVRVIRPRYVVETGTHDGLGTSVLARAVERNAADGSSGHVLTFDVDEAAGRLVPEHLRQLVEFHTGDTHATLAGALKGRVVGVFIHDSLHMYGHERFEFECALRLQDRQLVLISDNAHGSSALADLCEDVGASYSFFRERPKDHFYPGAGIGLGLVGTAQRTSALENAPRQGLVDDLSGKQSPHGHGSQGLSARGF